MDPAQPAPFAPVVDLGGQHLGQVAEVGGVAALRHLGQAHALGAHRRQVELPGGRPDGGLGRRVGHLGHHPTPSRSS